MKSVPSSNRLCEVPAPRVTVKPTGDGYAVEPESEDLSLLAKFEAAFLDAFGTTERVIAEALYQQILGVLHADSTKPLDATIANFVLALLYRIGPKDELEAMLTCQMITAHVAVMDTARRALHVEQTSGGRQVYLSLSRKMAGLFAVQMDTLNRHRGKCATQKIVVERVYVAPGAQAIVGAVAGPSTRGSGG